MTAKAQQQTDQELALAVLRRATLPGGTQRNPKLNHSASAGYETERGQVTVDVECNQHSAGSQKTYFVSVTITTQVQHHSEAVAFIDAKVREERAA